MANPRMPSEKPFLHTCFRFVISKMIDPSGLAREGADGLSIVCLCDFVQKLQFKTGEKRGDVRVMRKESQRWNSFSLQKRIDRIRWIGCEEICNVG